MDREKRRAGRGRGRGAGRTRREGFDDEGGRGRGRGRGRGEERGLRGFSGSGMRGRGDTEDEEEFARRRFMEKDLELWESASTRPASKPKWVVLSNCVGYLALSKLFVRRLVLFATGSVGLPCSKSFV